MVAVADARRIPQTAYFPDVSPESTPAEGAPRRARAVISWPVTGGDGEEKTMDERRSFWQRFFGGRGGSSLSQRQQKVLEYILQRMGQDAPLQQIVQEEYVRRNSSQAEVERIVASPEFIEAARQQLGDSFRSDEFKL